MLFFVIPRSSSGSVAVLVSVMLLVLVGFTALGTEVVALLMAQRRMQVAADSAVLAAVTARATGYPAAYADEAVALARAAGYVDGEGAITVDVNTPPLSGSYAGSAKAVEVVIRRTEQLALVSLFRSAGVTLTARAVGIVGDSGLCVLALSGSIAGAIQASNGAIVQLTQCGVGANSTSSTAITVSGAALLAAASLTVVGNYRVTTGGTLNISGAIETGAPATTDPYADRVVPTPGNCLSGGSISHKNLALPAGTYCSGITISNTSKVTLNGVYVVRDGDFEVRGGSTVSGTATIVLTGTGSGGNIGSVTISNGAILNITAPASGATAGMVFFQDRRAPSSGTNDFVGSSSNTLNGAVYFPNQILNFSNGSSASSICTQLVARRITFSGGINLKLSCAGMGTTPIGGGGDARLVE
jgi:hypothetical protein